MYLSLYKGRRTTSVFSGCYFTAHGGNEVGGSSKPDCDESASLERRVFNEDRPDHFGAVRLDFPKHGVGVSSELAVGKGAAPGDDDCGSPDLAINEDEVTQNGFVSCEFGEPDDLALVCLVSRHGTIISWIKRGLR